MSVHELEATIMQLAIPGKGLLAADESQGTITKRFSTIHLDSTSEQRRAYRDLLFTTPGLAEFVSGVILYEETLAQQSTNGTLFPELLAAQGIVPGIKVDKGVTSLPNSQDEKITQGLDGLAERLATYKEMGARFAKWRAVLNIGKDQPSSLAIKANAEALARYAAICQAQGIVPIVEPELLMDGDHTLEQCAASTEHTLHVVFHALQRHHVMLETIILKPSMVLAGASHQPASTINQVAAHTLKVLYRTVPAAVPMIAFLSGGQSAEVATAHLNAMNNCKPHPWQLSFSYGRALQDPCLKAWQGKKENIHLAQQALYKRAKLNSLASKGQYSAEMEK